MPERMRAPVNFGSVVNAEAVDDLSSVGKTEVLTRISGPVHFVNMLDSEQASNMPRQYGDMPSQKSQDNSR